MKPTDRPNQDRANLLSIRAGNLSDVFADEDGKLVRGIMIAYNERGQEVARGATYQEFMESLRENRR
ncbi:MAG: hypothetical protein KC978_05260 [Candidatus Omnitrophica bacterium]|nr:hypothetical protein [Candidatus Omnitrophota bacterium]